MKKSDTKPMAAKKQRHPATDLAGINTLGDGAAAFIAAAGKHRHPVGEMDPPLV